MLLKLCHMILLLYKCSRYKGRKCDELSSEVLPGCQERDDFFLLLVYLHFLINFKRTHTVRGVYDVIAIALLFLKSKIQSSTLNTVGVTGAFSVCVRGQTKVRRGAHPDSSHCSLSSSYARSYLVDHVGTRSHPSRIPWLESPETLLDVSGPNTL